METSTGFHNLRGVGKVLDVCGWSGEDIMDVVVPDEVVFEVPGPDWRMPVPEVMSIRVVEVLLSLF